MSDFAYSLSQSVPLVKKYQVGTTPVANIGVPLLIDASGEAGLNVASTTVATDFVGMSLETAAYSTTQGTGENSAESLVSVIIQQDAVWRARMSQGATANTAISLRTVTTANAAGVNVITGDDFSDPDDGVIWCYSGANAGQSRKITTGDATDASVLIPFDSGIAVGDIFLTAPYWYFSSTAIQFITDLHQADVSIATDTGGAFAVIAMELRDESENGRNNSYVLFVAQDHVLGGGQLP